jgi:hypothetical protein
MNEHKAGEREESKKTSSHSTRLSAFAPATNDVINIMFIKHNLQSEIKTKTFNLCSGKLDLQQPNSVSLIRTASPSIEMFMSDKPGHGNLK